MTQEIDNRIFTDEKGREIKFEWIDTNDHTKGVKKVYLEEKPRSESLSSYLSGIYKQGPRNEFEKVYIKMIIQNTVSWTPNERLKRIMKELGMKVSGHNLKMTDIEKKKKTSSIPDAG